MSRERAEAVIAAERTRRNFGRWLAAASPLWSWDWRHLVYVRTFLDRLTCGEINRLAIFLPPQFGKSQMTTVRYPVWRLERDPALRVAVAAYNQTHANRFSRRALKIAQERGLALNPKRVAVEEWETEAQGGVRAVGVGSGITGNPVDLLVIDDPVKNREEAESATYRERVKEWYADDLYTRLQPGAAVILIQTRWHTADLGGWILSGPDAANWSVVNLPAEAEENDPLGRPLGEPLCPERFTAEDLANRRRVLGGPSYSALYQQRPVPREGAMFRAHDFPVADAAPARMRARARYWDKAGAAPGKGDWTVGVLMGRDADGLFWVEDVVRGQWPPDERNRVILQTAELDRARGHVKIYVEQPPGLAKESTDAVVRLLAGFSVEADRVVKDKASRAEPLSAQCRAGNVRMVRGPWNAAYLAVMTTFPVGPHDDDVDATSGAFNKLAGGASVYERRGVQHV